MALFNLFRRKPWEREAFALYSAAVAAARQPWFYAELGVPDTLDGRFDLINLHMALLVRRLRRDADPRGAQLAQSAFDAMFTDMDQSLREMGVSDLVVGKRMKNLWDAFHGRAVAYESALDAGDEAALALALARNVWRGEPPGLVDGSAAEPARRLAAQALAQVTHLAAQDLSTLLAGEVRFSRRRSRTMAEPRPELSRPIPLGAIPEAGRDETIRATPAECAALAFRFAIPAVEALEARLHLEPEEGGAVSARGRLAARVVQECVVTLELVTQEVDAPIDIVFRRAGEALSDDPDGPDEIEIEGHAIELGEAVAEQLSLALDPYPRLPGAALPPMEEEPEEAAPEPVRLNPFAALAKRGRTP